jgi:hypothetical protein
MVQSRSFKGLYWNAGCRVEDQLGSGLEGFVESFGVAWIYACVRLAFADLEVREMIALGGPRVAKHILAPLLPTAQVCMVWSC